MRKTTIATELFSRDLITGFDWPADKCFARRVPDGMSIADITGLLSSGRLQLAAELASTVWRTVERRAVPIDSRSPWPSLLILL